MADQQQRAPVPPPVPREPLAVVADPQGSLGESALAGALETMPAGFFFLDRQWRIRYVNAEAQRMTGRTRAALLDRSIWDVYPRMAGTPFERAYRTAVRTGRPVTVEAPYEDRRAGWYQLQAWPGPDGLAVYFLDVTAQRRAEDVARRATERLRLLARVTAELSGALDGESALGRLAQLVVPTLSDACIVTVVDREGRARDVGSWHADPARQALLARYAEVRLETLPPSSPVALALTAGMPVTQPVADVLELMHPGPARDLLLELGPETATVLPLPAEDRTVGVLTLYHDAGRALDEDDLDTAREVAAQAGRAVERVHRQSEQAKLAEELQRSLLTDPPEIPCAAVVVRYVPAAEAARVGGDWYDAFLQRDGTPVVVIGDVVGHDTAAAAAMGQLRGLLRGIAHHSGAGPAEVLRGLDEAIASMHTGTLATAAVARLEGLGTRHPAGLRLRWANAGHPPPFRLSATGEVHRLGGLLGDLMLGVDHIAVRAESVADLAPGDTVFLYTDGLVERRDSTLDQGLRRLAACLSAMAGRPLDELCDAVLDGMLDRRPDDDVAVVAVTVHPGGHCSARAPDAPTT